MHRATASEQRKRHAPSRGNPTRAIARARQAHSRFRHALKTMYKVSLSSAGFPMAPSQEEWDAMNYEERAEVLDALPGEVTDAEMSPPEGDKHFKAKTRALEALRGFFARTRPPSPPRHYPAPPLRPDLLAVLDADDGIAIAGVVSAESRGLDWVLEVHVGRSKKDRAQRDAHRGSAHSLHVRSRNQLCGLTGVARRWTYRDRRKRYESRVLGLDLQVEDDRLRFYSGTALLLDGEELVSRLERMIDEVQQRADEEARLREEETRLREAAEHEVARLREELERVKGR